MEQRQRAVASSRRRKVAVADALAGVVGSLVSLWVFYPLEVVKTQVQAAPSRSNSSISSDTKQPQKTTTRPSSNLLNSTSRRLLETLAAGWKWKTLHTACSSFCYFFLYSWIVSLWTSKSSLLLLTKTAGNNAAATAATKSPSPRISTAARLVLSATAAMLNTFLTLPLDVVAARQQQTPSNEEDDDDELEHPHDACNATAIMTTLWRIQEEDYYKDASALDDEESNQGDAAADEENNEKEDCHEEKKEDSIFEWKDSKHIKLSTTTVKRRSPADSSSNLAYILSLWKGLGPSLLLCTNPAIHYTCYDTMKSRILLRRHGNSSSNTNNSNLTMGEAFLLGLMAKFVATIVTYPLIRTKVMLMVAATSPLPVSRGTTTSTTTTTTSMLQCLRDEFQANGMRGLYQGCNLQLLHTLLKSALLMMIRERLTRTTSRIVLGNNAATTPTSTISS